MNKDSAILWQPGERELTQSNLARFAVKNGFEAKDYNTLYRWSRSDLEGFWNAVWDFTEVIGERGETVLVRREDEEMFGARWYPDARLNFAENMLCGADSRLAVIEANEQGVRCRISMGDLRKRVAKAQSGLARLGLHVGDRVVAIMPNNLEALVALLATASLGGVWASCSPDFGAAGIIDRIGQVEPKILIGSPSYRYNGKRYDVGERLDAILAQLPTVEHVVMTSAVDLPAAGSRRVLSWEQLCSDSSATLRFERVPFSSPLYVMFSSGTTGLPKAIVQTVGGVLLEHKKEHLLHGDVQPGEVVSWYTNTAWMMYHWFISALACQAAILLYDGAPILKKGEESDYDILWRIAEEAGVAHFGTSPRYLAALAEAGYEPGRRHPLKALRAVLSAGAPVAPEQFDWLYRAVKKDMIFASVSGGTEIIGCFLLGSPVHPVRRGELTCKSLGLAVDVLDERGASVIGRKGDLVCTEPFPSAPLTFWGKDGDKRYYNAYFAERPGIWTHGDLAEQTVHDSAIIYGRTDTTLKPGGVRIGTAEIYNVIERQPEIRDCVVFGRRVDNDEKIVLCVVLQDGTTLTPVLEKRLRDEVRKNASPRHVPDDIHQVHAVPYTINGKRVEGAARSVVAGKPVKNLGSLANPQCLEEYAALYQTEATS
ncbi:MAG: acetoacetate--CoA ligase [Candidimonas sp.]|nr:MAG: acetoacetate--CoA ligase [Candidimonas sp.]